jgi:cobaltochelatase CobN
MTRNNKADNHSNRKCRRPFIFSALILLIAMILWIFYSFFVSPTRIAVVNFKDFQYAAFIKADKSSFIKLDRLTLEKSAIPDLSKYKVIYILAHGMDLNQNMRQAIEDARAGGAYIYMHGATNKETDLTNISGQHLEHVGGYFRNGGVSNYAQLFNYSRRVFEKKILFTNEIVPPRKVPRNTFFHLGETNYFDSYRDYLDYYKKKELYKENAPTVCLFTANIGPQSGSREHIDALINQLENKGINLFPISGFGKRIEFLKQVKPELAIILPHGRFASGRGDELIQYLKSNQIPLLCPITIFSPVEKWKNDQRGMVGGIMSQSIAVPELDGGIEPITIAALFKNKQGLHVFDALPGRIKRFGNRVSRWLALKSKPASQKKVAVYYYKGPGKNALVAGGLEVTPSLLNFLKRLKKEGYQTGPLPVNAKELSALIQKRGSLIAQYAGGRLSQYLKDSRPFLVESSQYEKWAAASMTTALYEAVEKQHGAAPGNYMAVEKDGKQYLAVTGIQFGNVVLLPQPLPGGGADEARLIHGVKQAPPHNYIASYLWTRYQFKADAVIHFGTHGSLEFTPDKQVALSADDWPDILMGDLPHIYLYTIDNIGEAIIAKRRSYAVIASHITPPFSRASAYGECEELFEKIHDWEHAEHPLLKQRIAEKIKNLIIKSSLQKDLELPNLKEEKISDAVIEKVHDYIHNISEARITKGLYTVGTPYKPSRLIETVVEMSFPAIADSLADIDIANGKFKPSIKKDLHRFSELYHGKARKIVEQVIADPGAIQKLLSIRKKQEESNNQFKQALKTITRNYNAVKSSFGAELKAITDALAGGYIPPAPGSDPIRNPMSVPTGRNLYALDAERTPTPEAWDVGKMLAEQIIEAKKKKNGNYPKKVAISLWGGEFIRGHGTNIAQIFYFLGVEPIRNSRGRVHDVRLIPMKELGRPRIDVVVQTSGQFRDLAASRIYLIDKAVKLAQADDDNRYDNYIRDTTRRMEGILKEKGLSPKEARQYSTARVFGGVNGNYGTGIMGLVESGDKWEKDSEIAEKYLNNMGAVYSKELWGQFKPGVFESALKDVDTVLHPNSSNTNGPLSLDHIYEFMGGLNATVRNVSGNEPDAWFNDLRNSNQPGVLELKKAIWMEVRSKFLNPTYIKALREGGAGSAETIAETYRNTYGWNVMKPEAIDKEVWDNFYDTYIEDKYRLNLKEFFGRENPYAFQEMTAVMLESIRKGLWKADKSIVKKLAQLHAGWVVKHTPGCSGFVCNNKKLKQMVADNLQPQLKKQYNQVLQQVKNVGKRKNKEGMVLKKDTIDTKKITQFIKNNWKSMLSIGMIITFLFLLIIIGKIRKK